MQLVEKIGIPELKNAVKFSRKTGYFLHDIRNPEFFSVPQTEEIKEVDKAFIDAANELQMPFELFAGYGESDEAMASSDSLADDLLDTSNPDGPRFKTKSVYATAFPFFKVNMKKWMSQAQIRELDRTKEYWRRHAP